MHVLTVAYGHPTDPEAFDRYYDATHRTLAAKVPGTTSFHARRCVGLEGEEAPYYMLAELAFESAEDLAAGLGSPEGQAAAADVANFADGGVKIFVQHD